MPNPSIILRNVEEGLHSVIVSLIDVQREFQKVGENMKDETFKEYFLAESLKYAEFRGDIEAVLRHVGMHDLVETGSVSGFIFRVWAGLQAKLQEGDHALLITAEQVSGETVQTYRDVLDKELPLPVRQLLSSQAAYLEGSREYIKSARDCSR